MKKKQILFVDDELSILESIQRIFYDMDDEWDMEFANNGNEALEYMKVHPFDVIISDMRMPEMDGAELLNKVKTLYPSTIRFILSGFSDKEMILRTVGPADQFLTKPCNPKVIKEAIINALEAQKLVDKEKLRAIASKLKSLPTLPVLYIKLRETIESDTSSFKAITKIVQADVAIAAKILQLVNSAFFGLKHRIDNLQMAISYLGLESLKAIILTTDAFSKFTKQEIDYFDVNNLNNHCIFVSMLARKIMSTLNTDNGMQDIACMAGMLHDIGKLIFIRNNPKEYKEIYRRSKEKKTPLFIIEREILGITHADIGGYLMSIWGLPEDIVKIISLHHSVTHALVDKLDPMAIVFIANVLAHEKDSDILYNVEREIEKGSLTKIELMTYLPEWREITRILKEIHRRESENNE